MLSTHPAPCSRRTGPTARMPLSAPSKFTRKYRSKPSGRISAAGAVNGAAPALLTSTSTAPRSARVRRTRACICPRSVTSVGTARAFPPTDSISAAAASSSGAPRAARTTAAPARANAAAMALPIPRFAPVTTATFPQSEPASGCASVIRGGPPRIECSDAKQSTSRSRSRRAAL